MSQHDPRSSSCAFSLPLLRSQSQHPPRKQRDPTTALCPSANAAIGIPLEVNPAAFFTVVCSKYMYYAFERDVAFNCLSEAAAEPSGADLICCDG